MAAMLSGLSLSFLNGSATSTPSSVMRSASKVHACLHVAGGKVAGPSLWRKSVDEAVLFCATALRALRTTYVPDGAYRQVVLSIYLIPSYPEHKGLM